MLRRLFFAIPAQSIQHALIECQISQGLEPRQVVPPVNFHLTLHFLGATDEQRIPVLINIGHSIRIPAFTLLLNQYGIFPKAQCLWIGPAHRPPELQNLLQTLHQQLNAAGWHIEPDAEKHYRPHVTLSRHTIKYQTLNNTPILPLKVDEFRLYESISARDGVIYQPLACWSLPS